MKCLRCLAEYEYRKTEVIRAAEYIYNGMTLCAVHAKTVRGHREDFDRYSPEEMLAVRIGLEASRG